MKTLKQNVMKKSLQKIEDYYICKGLSGSELRKALELDKKYQKILSERKRILTKKFAITTKDKKRYVLSTDQDYMILSKVYQLEQKRLSSADRKLMKFIRTQLELDWRSSIIKLLDELLKKYK